MDQQQEKASKALGQAVSDVVQSGLYGVAEATQAHAFRFNPQRDVAC